MRVTVGRIGRAHGVRGYVVVGVRTDEPESRFAVGSSLDTDPVALGPLKVAAARWHSGELLVRFEGVTDRTAAEGLRGTWLGVDSSSLTPLPGPDEFRDTDLIGLSVRTVDGTPVGEVTDVLHHGQDLLAIRPVPVPGGAAAVPDGGAIGAVAGGAATVPDGGAVAGGGASAEILVPFVKAIVTEVDVAAGVLVIDPPQGLLDPDAAV